MSGADGELLCAGCVWEGGSGAREHVCSPTCTGPCWECRGMPWGSCPCPGVEMRGLPPLAPPLDFVCVEAFNLPLTLPGSWREYFFFSPRQSHAHMSHGPCKRLGKIRNICRVRASARRLRASPCPSVKKEFFAETKLKSQGGCDVVSSVSCASPTLEFF